MIDARCPRCQHKLAEVQGSFCSVVWKRLRVVSPLPTLIDCRVCGTTVTVQAGANIVVGNKLAAEMVTEQAAKRA